jgi:hypothetical protein
MDYDFTIFFRPTYPIPRVGLEAYIIMKSSTHEHPMMKNINVGESKLQI